MAVTRINNNQITDASAGNVYVGVNAASKLQNYTITSQKIANNLVYGSDLTVSGNLTVNGTTTTVDTVNTLIQDPLITLADGQTSGTPTVDIGLIGLRGSENSAVMAWKEDQSAFVTALSTTTISNTTFTITSYANIHTGNAVIEGTTSLVGNLIGAVNATGNITGGNLLTPGLISATATITGGNLATGGTISGTGNITGGNVSTAGVIDATGTITGGNLSTGGTVNSTGNITGGNVLTAGLMSATGNVNGGNLNAVTGITAATGYFTGNVDVLGNLNATIGVVYANSGIFYGNAVTGDDAAFAGVPGFTPLASNVVMQFAGNVNAYSQLNFENINTGTQASGDIIITADNGTDSTNFVDLGIAGSGWDGTQPNSLGNAIFADDSYLYAHDGNLVLAAAVAGDSVKIIAGGSDDTFIVATIASTGVSVTGVVSATGNVTGGNLLTGGLISSTGTITSATTITGGNLSTGGTVNATGNITGGNLSVGSGLIVTTGNVNGGNVNTNNIYGTTTISLNPGTGNINVNSTNINNLADPANPQDAATKYYVDSVAQGLDIKASVVYATVTNLPAYTYNNGASGVGATLTAQAVGNLTIDGTVVSAGQRVLIKNEVGAFVDNTTQSAAFNGIYEVTTAGSPSVAYVLTRTTDFDNGSPSGEIPGAFTFVEHGATEADTGWVCTSNAPITVGTTQIIWAQFSGAGTYTAGSGLSLTGTQFNVLTDGNANPTTAINGSNQVVVPAGAEFITPNIGIATGTSLSVTGNITSGNLVTGGTVESTGNITGGNVLTSGIVSATATITGGNLATGGTISGTGNITGGNVLTGGLISSTGTIDSATTITGGNLATGGTISGTGNITGGNVLTGGLISSTGNITGGNLVTGGAIDATGNITGGNVLTSGNVSATGNIIAANFIGNISGNIDAAGSNTQVQFNDTNDILGASAGFTFDKTANLLTVAGNVAGGNITTAGQVSATANITGGNVIAVANIDGANITASTQLTGGNIVITGDDITDTNGRVNFNTAGADVDFAVNGDTVANVFYVDAGTGTASFGSATQTTNAIVAFNAPTSVVLPTGNTAQRPGTGVTGMARFNTTNNNLEVYDNSQWTAVGVPVFTVIDDEQFNGDGSTVAFTLGSTQTTNSCIVSINGVVQIPTIAYSVSGTDPTCVLTFTEAPAAGDIIDVREVTTTTTVTSIANSGGNAVVAVSPTTNDVQITGDILPTANITYNLGSTTARWNDLWLANSTIYIGNSQISANATSLIFTSPQGGQTVFAGSTGGDLTVSNIINSNANGVGNIGSSTGYFNTVFAKATSAQYADLAEKYVADAEYAPGTVLVFGGTHEVTVDAVDADRKVAGVVSTNPSYIMNGGLEAEHVATVALTGRVPTMVVGPVKKGDLMVTAGLGRARAEADPRVGTVIGKALEDFDGAEGTIEVVVGRF